LLDQEGHLADELAGMDRPDPLAVTRRVELSVEEDEEVACRPAGFHEAVACPELDDVAPVDAAGDLLPGEVLEDRRPGCFGRCQGAVEEGLVAEVDRAVTVPVPKRTCSAIEGTPSSGLIPASASGPCGKLTSGMR
jgi:hypothetical protein